MPIFQLDLATLAVLTISIPFLVGLIGVAGILFQAWRFSRFRKTLDFLTVFASAVSLALSLWMVLISKAEHLTPSLALPILGRIGFLIDSLSLYFILLVNVIALAATWNSIEWLKAKSGNEHALFHTLTNLFHVTMLLVPLVDNLIILWIAIEATTLVSTMLVGFEGKKDSWEAAWKYLVITSTGIIFALLGTMFLANAAKGLIPKDDPNIIMNWSFLIKNASHLTQDFVKLSFLFILVGYGTKAGFAPMHTWLPDGHGEAPAPISALLSGVLLKSALYAILRFYTITNATLGDAGFTSKILLGSGLLSLLLATPFILKENRFKRVLAYHSLEHMGIITFGVGIGGPIAMFGALLHTFNHAITKALMFISFGNILRQYEKAFQEKKLRFDQNQITGVLHSMPFTGAVLVLGGLALVGAPPFNIFMSELIILWGSLKSLNLFKSPEANTIFPDWIIITAVVLFMLSTTLIFYGLVRHLAKIALHKMSLVEQKLEESFSDRLLLGFLLLIAVVFGFGVIPPLSRLISASVNIILNVKS